MMLLLSFVFFSFSLWGWSFTIGVFYLPSLSVALFQLYFDPYKSFFFGSLLFISYWVLKFSKVYMIESYYYLWLMYMFISSMLLLVVSDSWLSLFISWDGLGITSYFLVQYYSSYKSYEGSLLTYFTNRLGDLFLLMAFLFYIYGSGTLFFKDSLDKFTMSLLILACMTKSSIIPFNAWLPAAMAAPTPVSALVHSSTLVTAGVFTLFTFHYSIIQAHSGSLQVLGALTMLYGSFMAANVPDVKKLVAYSTMSHMGFIFMSLGLLNKDLAFWHMCTHAYFKSLLFLLAGYLIMKSCSGQYTSHLAKSESCFLNFFIILTFLGSVGTPFLSVTVTKHLVIESVSNSYSSVLLLFVLSFALFFTGCYSGKILSIMSLDNSSNPVHLLAPSMVPVCFLGGGVFYCAYHLSSFLPLMDFMLTFHFLDMFIIILGFIYSMFSFKLSSGYKFLFIWESLMTQVMMMVRSLMKVSKISEMHLVYVYTFMGNYFSFLGSKSISLSMKNITKKLAVMMGLLGLFVVLIM